MTDITINRKDFIQKNLILAGTVLVSPFAMAMTDSSKIIRIGVVGGRFGRTFQWHEHPNCRVEAVSELRPERRKALMATYKCAKSYVSLEEMVKDRDIDAIAVFTEGPNHVKHTVECMKHGKHVIAAVPACRASVAEAELLLE